MSRKRRESNLRFRQNQGASFGGSIAVLAGFLRRAPRVPPPLATDSIDPHGVARIKEAPRKGQMIGTCRRRRLKIECEQRID